MRVKNWDEIINLASRPCFSVEYRLHDQLKTTLAQVPQEGDEIFDEYFQRHAAKKQGTNMSQHTTAVCQEAREIADHIRDSFGVDVTHTVSVKKLNNIADELADITDLLKLCHRILGKDAKSVYQAPDADVRRFLEFFLEPDLGHQITKVVILQKVIAHARACLTRE